MNYGKLVYNEKEIYFPSFIFQLFKIVRIDSFCFFLVLYVYFVFDSFCWKNVDPREYMFEMLVLYYKLLF